MKVEITYADKNYSSSLGYNVKNAKRLGHFDKVYAYGPEDIDADFKKKNERFFSSGKGGGYWIWKSYIVKKTLEQLVEGDYLFYCDAGAFFIRPIDKLIKLMESNGEDMMFFAVSGCLEREWTKRDIFITLNCDTEEYANSTQNLGGFWLIKKNHNTVAFVDEYYQTVQKGMLITDRDNELGMPNYDGFKENRHDQSVLSLLAKKHGYKAYRDPSQWGSLQRYKYKYKTFRLEEDYRVYEKSKYPMMILLHRLRGKASLRGILGCYKFYLMNCWKLRRNKGIE